MNGTTLRIGAVAGLKGFEHAITVARAVMEKCPHNVLVAEGAAEFARKMGIEESTLKDLITEQTWKEYLKNREHGTYPDGEGNPGHDTVGTVTLDQSGTL